MRESEELLSGMVKGAHWVATSKVSSEHQDWTQFLLSLNKEIEIFVYCAVGGRASRVVKILRNKGFKAKNMGGFSDWAKKGLPVQKMCRSNGSVKPC